MFSNLCLSTNATISFLRGFLGKHFDDTIAISTYDHWIRHFGHDHTCYSIHMVSHQALLLLDCIRITWGIGWIVSRCEWRPRSWPALNVSELEVEFDTFNCVWATSVTGRMSELVVKWTLPFALKLTCSAVSAPQSPNLARLQSSLRG